MLCCPATVRLIAASAALLGVLAARSQAQTDWVIRPIVAGEATMNADVMVSAGGHVAVGWGLYPPPGGPVQLARLQDALFERQLFSLPGGYAASFAMDDYGGVYYASNLGYPSSTATFGQDLGMWGGMREADLAQIGPCSTPVVALDNHGLPAIAGAAASYMTYASFDVRSGKWQRETIGPTGGWAAFRTQSLCFDAADRGTLAYFEYPGAFMGPAPLRIAAEGMAGWSNSVVAQDAIPARGVSIAASSSGGVGFAYMTLAAIMFGTSSGGVESVAPAPGYMLLPHSLAFDGDGNPAIVCQYDGGLRLFRRNGGVWSDELMPVEAPYANVTFDIDGNPYVVTAGTGVTLLGPALPMGILGDFDGDNDADAADIDLLFDGRGTHNLVYDLTDDGAVDNLDVDAMVRGVLATEYGDYDLGGVVNDADLSVLLTNWSGQDKGWANGDFNGDNVVNDADLSLLLANWEFGVGAAGAPEPAAVMMLGAAAPLLVRRRRMPLKARSCS